MMLDEYNNLLDGTHDYEACPKMNTRAIKKYGFESLINRKFNFQLNEMMQIMRKDKKNQNGNIKMVLPTKVGKCKYDVCIKQEIIENCLMEILK